VRTNDALKPLSMAEFFNVLNAAKLHQPLEKSGRSCWFITLRRNLRPPQRTPTCGLNLCPMFVHLGFFATT
jgi:hypothetical protein